MHPNPAFRGESNERSIAFVRERAFGVLAVNAEAGPLLSHVPLLLSDDSGSADLHLVRSNPIARLDGVPAVVAVNGPDGYVSPDWYGVEDQVPTWNYVAVHLRGRLERLSEGDMREMLDRQSAHFEEMLRPKPPWLTDKMTPGVMERMMRMIVPYKLRIDVIEGTWKLSQNKPETVRLAASEAMARSGIGQETGRLARLMTEVPPERG